MEQILATKLFIPTIRPERVSRPRLIKKLNDGLYRKLTLISAPAGFGKTTLVSDWLSGGERPVTFFTLDEGDSDIARFLTYFIAALQSIDPILATGIFNFLRSPQPPPIEATLTVLVNEVASVPNNFILVLDDYHLIDAPQIHDALSFLIENLPPQSIPSPKN